MVISAEREMWCQWTAARLPGYGTMPKVSVCQIVSDDNAGKSHGNFIMYSDYARYLCRTAEGYRKITVILSRTRQFLGTFEL